MPDPEIVIVQSTDPKSRELEAAGYTIVAESWGAGLFLADPIDLSHFQNKVDSSRADGFRPEELTSQHANSVFNLELSNHVDYPQTPATTHELPTFDSTLHLWEKGKVFGVLLDHEVIGVIAASQLGEIVELDFGSVLREYRGKGIGATLVSMVVISYATAGVRIFRTGGAAENEASKRTVTGLGFIVDETWHSYANS